MNTSGFSKFCLVFPLILTVGLAAFFCVAEAGMLGDYTHASEPPCADGTNTLLCAGGKLTNHFQMFGLFSSGLPQTASSTALLFFLAGLSIYSLIQSNHDPNLVGVHLVREFNSAYADFSANPILEFLRQGIMHPKLYSALVRTGG